MKQYLDLMQEIMDHGVDRPNRTGVNTRAVFGRVMRFDMANGFPAMTTKRLYFHGVKAELLWFLKGSSDNRELQKLGVHIWDTNANSPNWKPKAQFDGDLGRVYGVQWRSWQRPDGTAVDQIKQVIEQIRKDPYGRRHIVTAWNPGELERMALPPCHMIFQFFVAEETLSLKMDQRSCDMFLGVPFNIASYALLLHMVAQITGLKTGEFVHVLGDTHIYHNHFDQTREQLSREPYPLPTLWLNPKIKDIDRFTMDDIKLKDYQSHPTISAPMND